MYSLGDLLIIDSSKYGEIVGVTPDNHIEVSFLCKTDKQEGRIWEFASDDKWQLIAPTNVTKHVSVPEGSDGNTVSKAWRSLGFVAGGDGITFCRIEDERLTNIPILLCEVEEDEEGTASVKLNMHGYEEDGFVIPDDEGENFDFADPAELDEEAAKFVHETHQAVHDFDKWQPTDKQGKGIKDYIDRMDHKAAIETDNQRFSSGKSSISTSKPPLKRKR